MSQPEVKSYAIRFTCKHTDDTKSNKFRVYDYPQDMSAGSCYMQAMDDIKDEDESIVHVIISDMNNIN